MASYEEERRRRVEENRKRLRELGILDLSKQITNKSSSNKTSKPSVKKIDSGDHTPIILRRSSRFSPSSRIVYREIPSLPSARAVPRKSSREKLAEKEKRPCSEKARLAAKQAAETFQKKLNSDHPIVIRSMVHSQVSHGFWMGLPAQFARANMPKKDTIFILEDSDEDESECLYICSKTGLSAGWRAFSIHHNLQEGDAVIFELVKPTRFKIHIIRAADYEENDHKTEHEKLVKGREENELGDYVEDSEAELDTDTKERVQPGNDAPRLNNELVEFVEDSEELAADETLNQKLNAGKEDQPVEIVDDSEESISKETLQSDREIRPPFKELSRPTKGLKKRRVETPPSKPPRCKYQSSKLTKAWTFIRDSNSAVERIEHSNIFVIQNTTPQITTIDLDEPEPPKWKEFNEERLDVVNLTDDSEDEQEKNSVRMTQMLPLPICTRTRLSARRLASYNL